MTRLHVYRRNSLELETALSEWSRGSATALVYTPAKAAFALWDGSRLGLPPDLSLELSDIFEFRMFDRNVELRWLHDRDGKGTAVMIAEDELTLGDGWINETADRECEKLPSSHYLLWGHVKASGRGWVRLEERRIGAMYVPFDATGQSPSRLALEKVEYVAVVDRDFGNQAVVDERLVGIIPDPGPV